MGWIVKNFKCEDCGHEFEELYKSGDEEYVECENCGSTMTKPTLCAPALGKFSMADAEGRKSILKKRSEDHTKKKAMKEWKDKNL